MVAPAVPFNVSSRHYLFSYCSLAYSAGWFLSALIFFGLDLFGRGPLWAWISLVAVWTLSFSSQQEPSYRLLSLTSSTLSTVISIRIGSR